jgi:sugar phosphate isomerase/epimerase
MLGVQLYSVRRELAADRAGTLGRLAEIGFDAVEPFDALTDPAGLRALADDLGLAIPSVHTIQLLSDEPEPVLDAVATLGAELVIIPAGVPREDFTTREALAGVADRLNAISAPVVERGLRLGYHNHWWELEPTIDGRPALEVLADLLDPAVALEVDTYWAAVGGVDPVALLGRLGPRVAALHVKDGPIRKGEPHTAVGSAAMPVPEVLAAAPDALRIVELDDCATDMVEALAASHAYLTGLEVAG